MDFDEIIRILLHARRSLEHNEYVKTCPGWVSNDLILDADREWKNALMLAIREFAIELAKSFDE